MGVKDSNIYREAARCIAEGSGWWACNQLNNMESGKHPHLAALFSEYFNPRYGRHGWFDSTEERVIALLFMAEISKTKGY